MLTSSPGVALAAMAVSGTVILLALRLQRSTFHLHPRPCISYRVDGSGREKNRKNKKKRVHFAHDMVEPTGNGEEYRRHRNRTVENSPATFSKEGREENRGMPANRVALYNGILRDRLVHHRLASY
ncbi:uncharacterized protein LOC124912674 isoform X1 [Impatiens glandulifera]|uniref:uncharacterized protein LOC124912674 isoform X1 n=1 Tax=Impatiens glandulifera TaxID=253017 RepID=UPI001FB0DC41|nr:uncharacterized protein LOC124912674 isoform X1 [Impatiens glandulifera]